jgi:ATP-dependent Clp protease ATP-binding subunit ClpA
VRLRDNRIGTEHVLLGILGDEEGTAVRMLGRMGLSTEALKERLREARGRQAG